MPSRHPKPKNAFTPIGSMIDGIVRQCRPLRGKEMAQVWEAWESVVDSSIAANARPAACKGSLLLVHVANSSLMHYLRFNEKDLIEKLNRALGSEQVTGLKFKIGPV